MTTRQGQTFIMKRRRPATMTSTDAPAAASARGYYTRSLPAVYQEGDFGLRFVGAFERSIDPIVALLDNEVAHFASDTAPPDMLDLLCAWLGETTDQAMLEERKRALLKNAAEMSRRRGTRLGLELALKTYFPDLPLRVEDTGGVTWSRDASEAGEAKPSQFIVYCDEAVREDELRGVVAIIERYRPVQVAYRLRVRQAKRG